MEFSFAFDDKQEFPFRVRRDRLLLWSSNLLPELASLFDSGGSLGVVRHVNAFSRYSQIEGKQSGGLTGVEILASSIAGADETMFHNLLSCLSSDKQAKIKRYRHAEDSLRSLLGELMVRVYIGERYGLPNREITFEMNEHGKPYLSSRSTCHFNLSHSGQWVVAAFDELPVGIDIEMVRPIDTCIADRFFSDTETEAIRRQPMDQKLKFFYRLWTLKESYVKARGLGLSISLKSFSFELTEDTIGFKSDLNERDWYFQRYAIDPDYEMAVCGKQSDLPKKVTIISWQELMGRFETLML